MSEIGWLVVENICIMSMAVFLCWYFENGWCMLLLLMMNTWSAKKLLGVE